MNDAVVITLIGAVSAVIGIVIRYLFYSKCNKVKCCGCEIERDTIHEESNPGSNRGAEQFEIKTTPNDNKV